MQSSSEGVRYSVHQKQGGWASLNDLPALGTVTVMHLLKDSESVNFSEFMSPKVQPLHDRREVSLKSGPHACHQWPQSH